MSVATHFHFVEFFAVLHTIVKICSIESEVTDTNRGTGWKPWTFNGAVLYPAALFSASLAAILGLLLWQNARHGAILLASLGGNFTLLQTILYRYLSTLIIVCYGLFWSWIELDVKRLEPWFQMSEYGGAMSSNSVLLKYPAEFLPLVPFKAAKRRQWAVVCASAILVMVTWLVTPLQNGILNNSVLTRNSALIVPRAHGLVPVGEQASRMSNLLSSAYATTWLGQQLPPFATKEHATAPLLKLPSVPGNDTLITFSTFQYTTRLNCWQPVSVVLEEDHTITFDDGQGCRAKSMIQYPDAFHDASYAAYYFGYYDDPNVDNSLSLGGCPATSLHKFLAIWKRIGDWAPNFHDPENATALFCVPQYFKQPVNATISPDETSSISTTSLGALAAVSAQEFNASYFERLIANGAFPQATREDIAETTTIYQDSRLANMSLTVPTSNMIGYVVGSHKKSPEAYLNVNILADALQDAHQLLFSLALQSMFDTSVPLNTSITITSTSQAIVVIPAFATASLATIGLIFVLTLYLVYATSSKTSHLQEDPDTLVGLIAMTQNQATRSAFAGLSSQADCYLQSCLRPLRFTLGPLSQRGVPSQLIVSHEPCEGSAQAHACDDSPDHVEKSVVAKLKRPREYSKIVGIPFCSILVLLMTALVFLFVQSNKNGGLKIPTSNNIIQQLLFNYLPTALATVMEPFWVLLCRVTSLMLPLEQLHKRQMPASRSLLLRYASVPPQLLAWRTWKNGHYLLAAMSVSAVAANVLTVAMSGLFVQSTIAVPHFALLTATREPTIQRKSLGNELISTQDQQYDPFWILQSNFTKDTPLPPWTSQYFAVMPMRIDSTEKSTLSEKLQVTLPGYSADLQCQELSATKSDQHYYELNFNEDASTFRFTTVYRNTTGEEITCKPFNADLSANPFTDHSPGHYQQVSGAATGIQALEFSETMTAANGSSIEAENFCNALLVKGWFRSNITSAQARHSALSATTVNAKHINILSSTVISCQPRLKLTMLDTILTPTGSILSASPASPAIHDAPALTGLTWALNLTTTIHAGTAGPTWHTDLIATDWSNSLIKSLTQSPALLDPHLPSPNATHAIALTNDTYARLFAAQMSLLSSNLAPASAAENPPRHTATYTTSEARMFVSAPAFYVAIAILGLDLVVAVCFFASRPRAFLPRLPLSVASQIAYVAGGRMGGEIMAAAAAMKEEEQESGGGGRAEGEGQGEGQPGVAKRGGKRSVGTDRDSGSSTGTEQLLRALDRRGWRYGFGKYVGSDGQVGIGVEREPYVYSIE